MNVKQGCIETNIKRKCAPGLDCQSSKALITNYPLSASASKLKDWKTISQGFLHFFLEKEKRPEVKLQKLPADEG